MASYNINLPQLIDNVFNELDKRNLPDKTGIDFGSLKSHFIIGGDETGLQACSGRVKVFGDIQKAKHEIIIDDSRCSITLFRVGSTGGSTGPTIFLMKGVKIKEGYTKAWLIQNGAAIGSRIIMTPSAYMTDEAWEAMAEDVAKGIRAMPVIKDHPDWWALFILDGFICHFSSAKVMEIFLKYLILLVKEEGDSSHVCQLYDQDPAKKDKAELRFWLDKLRHIASVVHGHVDQWALLAIGLQAVRSGDANMWIESAKKVNLHPDHRRSFPIWLKDIEHFLEGGQSFKMENHSTDIYPLLPSLWHSMLPKDKRIVMDIMERHGGLFTPQCVNELFLIAHVMPKHMQKLRICIDAAKKNPLHLDMGMPNGDSNGDVHAEVALARANMVPVNNGLRTFQLIPPGLQGIDLLDHMVNFRKRFGEDYEKPSFDVEMSADQERIIAPTMQDLNVRAILKDAGGAGATKKLAARKLNNTGAITNHCGLQNQPERIKLLKSALQLAKSMAEISAVASKSKLDAKKKAAVALLDVAYPALTKFHQKACDVNKLNKNEVCAIAFRFFGTALKEADKKEILVAELQRLITARPTVIPDAIANPVEVAPAYAVAADSEEDIDEDDENGEYD